MTREQARREIDSLDYYLQNHTDDYGEESHTAMMMAIQALEEESYMEQWAKILHSEVNKLCIWCCPHCGATMEVKER